jgi:outer membrane protein assembly factor BamB
LLAAAGHSKNIEERIKIMLSQGKQFHKWPILIAATIVLTLILLTSPGRCDLNNQSNTQTAMELEKQANSLHKAAAAGDIEQVKKLVSEGANIDAKDKQGRTPLHNAAANGRMEVAELLIEKGADINAQHNSGGTPLHLAVNRGHKEMIELLITKGADINIKNSGGNAPIYNAMQRGYTEIVELLRAHGAEEVSLPEDQVVLLISQVTNIEPNEPNWPQFRGLNGRGIAETDHIPVDLTQESIILWETPVPSGHSSPVIWGDRIYLTANESAKEKEFMTLCINRENGNIMWRQTVQAQTEAERHPMNHPASSTPAVDEKHVYVYFGTYGLICYDHEGNKLWYRIIKTPQNQYGMATSPILYQNMVILVLDDNRGASRLLAVNQDTGETVWQKPRSLFRAGWSTPMIWRHGDVEELVVLGSQRLTSYNPSTGEEIWWAGGFSPETVGTPITGSGLLFASATTPGGRGDEKFDTARMWKITLDDFDKNQDKQIQRDEMTETFKIPMRPDLPRDNPGYGLGGITVWDKDSLDSLLKYFDKDKNGAISEEEWNKTLAGFIGGMQPTLLAVRLGATKDARESHIAWEIHQGIPEVPSLLYCRGRLYLMRDGGLLTCLEASTGKELFRERIGAAGQYIASPVAAGDKILFASAPGTVTIIQADDKLKILARKDFGEKIFATPAIVENKIYLRTEKNLYALGK